MKRSKRPLPVRAYGAWLRWLALVAPGPADRALVRRFTTPRRNGPEPAVPGVPGSRETLAFGDRTLAVWSWGSGPVVLAVHGWDGSAASWTAAVPALVRMGFRVVAPDLPAHGASSGRRTNVLEMAEAVRRVGQALGPLHAVVAHSAGGAAVALALRDGLRADRAVLLAPTARPALHLMDLASYLGLPMGRGLAALPVLENAIGAPLRAADASEAIRAVRVPGLVIHDRDDRRVDSMEGRQIATAWAGAHFVLTRGLGHGLHRDPAVVDAVVEFVAGPRRAIA
jgi:pimeloyl-ACP methyl ester carboxylesterase